MELLVEGRAAGKGGGAAGMEKRGRGSEEYR